MNKYRRCQTSHNDRIRTQTNSLRKTINTFGRQFKTRCTRGVRVVFSVTRMRSSNSARINKFDFRTEKIL